MKLKVIAHPMSKQLEEMINRFIEGREIVSLSVTGDGSRFYAYILYKEEVEV